MLTVVTNRKLCHENFIERIEKLANAGPDSIILREKDLLPSEYEKLAAVCKEICDKHGVELIINTFIEVATKLDISNIQLSMPDFVKHHGQIKDFNVVAVSVHSLEEAVEAEKLGANCLIAGHIFETDCKKGIRSRGLHFLQDICNQTSIPVFAIGGISESNISLLSKYGAAGACLMSSLMSCVDPIKTIQKYKTNLKQG